MPNKRKSNKKQLNAWVPDALAEEIAAIASETGRAKSAVVEMLLREQMGIYQTRKEKEHGDKSKRGH